jgi:hypothetical protein
MLRRREGGCCAGGREDAAQEGGRMLRLHWLHRLRRRAATLPKYCIYSGCDLGGTSVRRVRPPYSCYVPCYSYVIAPARGSLRGERSCFC